MKRMNLKEIEIKVIEKAERDAIKKLYQQAGWWGSNDETPDGGAWIDDMVRGSFCFVGAFAGDEMIGMGRAVSDGVSDAYIQDVTVLKEFRGHGLGARIIAKIVDFLENRRIGWIGLIAEPGTQAFYHRLGFDPMEGFSPMLLKKKKD
jgi:ribosomal protein S18 acetylase RimI-like enzyme